jgi:phenylacetate-CoA ligase
MDLIPWFRRAIVEPVAFRLNGSCLRSEWRALEESQHLAAPQIAEIQRARLSKLLSFAARHNAFYAHRFGLAGLTPEALTEADALARVPILTKIEVQGAGLQLISDGFERGALLTAKTGGSTGRPLHLFFEEHVSQRRVAGGRRGRYWAGWKAGEPIAAVWGNPRHPAGAYGRLRQWLLDPIIYLDTMAVDDEAVRAFARAWKGVRPTLLFGHAHSLFLLASLVRDLGLQEIRPKAIISSSMMLIPRERALIERVFGLRVFDMYGCEEVGLIASECEAHEGLHMNAEQVVVELLRDDGTPCAPGETGAVVVTDLQNRAMPLIRYRMEDYAEAARDACSCGRGLPLLRRVVGRTADFLIRRDGTRVAGVSLIENTLTEIEGIEQMQLVQTALDSVVIRVVPTTRFSLEREAQLAEYFRSTFPGATIRVERADRIAREANGKYRFSICQVAGGDA